MKTCSKCGKTKDESEYRFTKSGKTLQAKCRECCLKENRETHARYAARNPEKIALMQKAYSQTPEHKAMRKLYRATEKNKEYQKEYVKTYRKKPEEIAKKNAKHKEWRAKTKAAGTLKPSYNAGDYAKRRAPMRNRIKEALEQEAQTRRNIESLTGEDE
jgi:hypothetical protein